MTTTTKSHSPVTFTPDGQAHWTHLPGYTYEATGLTTNGRRFKRSSPSWWAIASINLWRGTRWLRDETGKRWKLQEVWN